MQVPKEPLFYSKDNAGLDDKADYDRQLLVQEQKACRARARQYTLETNRRRKALEDRKRKQDIQEQKLREYILQQRKQRLQEATERFQRAHLPMSQRTRSASNTRPLNLDEALSHIQGAQTSYTYQSPYFCGISTTNRSCIPSSKPPGGAIGPHSMRAVSAAQAYTTLIQERSLRDLKTSQLLQEQEQTQTQEHSDTKISHAESLSSLDSLENEVPQHGHGSSPDSLDLHDTRRSMSDLQRQINCPSPSFNHRPPVSFLDKVISQQCTSSSSFSSPSPVEDDSADEAQSVQNFTTEHCSITVQSQISNIQETVPCQKQVFAANSGHTGYQYGRTTQENISSDKTTTAVHCKMQTPPDIIPVEYSRVAQQSNSDAGEFSKCTEHLSDMQAAQNSSASDLTKVSPSLENSASLLLEAEKSFQSYIEKYKQAEHQNVSNEYSNRLAKSSKIIEEPHRTVVDTLTNHIDLKSSNVRFLKGILKKRFKSLGDGDAKFSYTPGHFTFSKQVAIAIRDSLELSRSKGRDPESNKCTKKKLRWLDEVKSNGGENKETVKDISKQAKTESRPTQPPQQPLVDLQQASFHSCYTNTPPGIPKNNMTSSNPSHSNSTKQAWSDVGSQKVNQQEPTEKFRVEKAPSCTTGLWVARQPPSARTGSGTITSQARKGTILRTQSSSQVVRNQGKVLVPRPPPRSEVTGGKSNQAIMYITKTSSNNECSQGKAQLATEQVINKDYPEGTTILAPVPPSYAHMYETVSKGIYSLCQSAGKVGSGNKGFQKRILERTPTDEEISLLWHGVRNALASKDGESPSLQTHNGPLSAPPPTQANLSHVTISRDSLFSGVKAVARMGGFFLSSSNVRSPIRRPTLENNMVKSRSAPIGYKKPPVLYQAPVPMTASRTDQMVHKQGPVVIGGDEQVPIDSAHFQRAAEFLQSQRGLSALSLEEQKLLQSLDRLDRRLQYLEDEPAGNTALKGMIDSPLQNQSPQPGERPYRRY